MITLQEAQERVAEQVPHGVRVVSVPLFETLGQCLAEELMLDADVPATDRSFMDGFAVRSADLATVPVELLVLGESRAGARFSGPVPAGAAVRIMTGATVPEGADAVVRVEDTSGFAGAKVTIRVRTVPGHNIRRRGHDGRAGERVLARGTRILPAQLGALAACGRDPVAVFMRPRVAVLSTGDEVVDVTAAPGSDQVRNSNAVALYGQVLQCGAVPVLLPIVKDTAAALGGAITTALDACEFLLTIGGVSAGIHDLVGRALNDHAVQTVFHGVAVKPGKPTFFGVRRGGDGRPDRWVFGLPGNPASCFTMFELLVRGALERWMGCRAEDQTAPVRGMLRAAGGRNPVVRADARQQVLPARVRLAADGVTVVPVPPGASSNVFPMAAGNVLFHAPAGTAIADGEVVLWQPY